MRQTDNYKLNKPDGTDNYNIEDFNENADKIDSALTAMNSPQTVSGWSVNSSLVGATGSWNVVYRIGQIVIVSINIRIDSTANSRTAIISGLPKPAFRASAIMLGVESNLRLLVESNGSVVCDGAISIACGWCSGCVMYVTAD